MIVGSFPRSITLRTTLAAPKRRFLSHSSYYCGCHLCPIKTTHSLRPSKYFSPSLPPPASDIYLAASSLPTLPNTRLFSGTHKLQYHAPVLLRSAAMKIACLQVSKHRIVSRPSYPQTMLWSWLLLFWKKKCLHHNYPQFNPQLGNIAHNLKRAETIISRAAPVDIDLLILPEMAFSGAFLLVTPFFPLHALYITSHVK